MEDRQHLRSAPRHITVEVLKKSLEEDIDDVVRKNIDVATQDPKYQSFPIESQKLEVEIEKLRLKNNELKDIIGLRQSWSFTFQAVVILILLFEIGITIAVGSGRLYFADEWFLRIIILGGIAQILAMPYLVTQFLFNTKSPLSQGDTT